MKADKEDATRCSRPQLTTILVGKPATLSTAQRPLVKSDGLRSDKGTSCPKTETLLNRSINNNESI